MARESKLVEPQILRRAIVDSFVKLNPRTMMRNPVMFVVGVGSVLTTILFFKDFSSSSTDENVFVGLVALFLWFTVLFANFAEAVAEGRGKAQADTLRKTRSETLARRRRPDGTTEDVPSTGLEVGDECIITGESAPVIRESGGDRSAVTGGTRVLSDEIVVRITARPGETFLDRMITLVEGSERKKTPNEIALNILLAGLTIIFLLATVTLQPFAMFSNAEQTVVILVALLVCLIPTTIGALLSAIGIAGMDRLVRRNVLAMSGRAVEAAGDCATLLLDKTGTITFGNREADAFIPVNGVTDEQRNAVFEAVNQPGGEFVQAWMPGSSGDFYKIDRGFEFNDAYGLINDPQPRLDVPDPVEGQPQGRPRPPGLSSGRDPRDPQRRGRRPPGGLRLGPGVQGGLPRRGR